VLLAGAMQALRLALRLRPVVPPWASIHMGPFLSVAIATVLSCQHFLLLQLASFRSISES